MSEILDVVNDNDEIIGQAQRDEVHRLGLICRLVYIFFYTTDGKVILQRRSLLKKDDAGRLTTTVSGHVSSGQTYLQAAIREIREESGIEIKESNLLSLGVVRANYSQGLYIDNAMRALFAYKYDGDTSDLRVEDGDGAGFVILPIDELERQLDAELDNFAMILTDMVGRDFITKIKQLVATT